MAGSHVVTVRSARRPALLSRIGCAQACGAPRGSAAMVCREKRMTTLIRDLIDIPEQVNRGDSSFG